MAVGNTITGSLADSLETIIARARQVREHEGTVPQLCDQHILDPNTGLSWHEISLDALVAQAVTETTNLNNPQQMVDTKLSITPTLIGIHTFVTDRVKLRVASESIAQLGSLAQNAMQRKKDEDGITALDGATTSLVNAGNTLTAGHIRAAVRRISSNATEKGNPPFRCVLHGYQIADLGDQLTSSVGTYELTSGETARVFKELFRGQVGSAQVFEAGNITIDSGGDAKGGVFAREALVLVQGRASRFVTERKENIGGGGEAMYGYEEYAYGERSAGNWLFEIYSDATAPTS